MEGIDGTRIVFVDKRRGQEGDGVHDSVFERGRHDDDSVVDIREDS